MIMQFLLSIIMFSNSVTLSESHLMTWDKFPCDHLGLLNLESVTVSEECIIREKFAKCEIYDIIKKINNKEMSKQSAISYFEQVYDMLKKTDGNWPHFLRLADDVLYYEMYVLRKLLSEKEIYALLQRIKKEHADSSLCNVKNLDDNMLSGYFRGREKNKKIDINKYPGKFDVMYLVEYCCSNTYDAALFLLAENSYLYLKEENIATRYYMEILNNNKYKEYASLNDFIISNGFTIPEEKSPYHFFVKKYYFVDNIYSAAIVRLLFFYLKKGQKNKATDLLDQYASHGNLFWLKEIRPLLDT